MTGRNDRPALGAPALLLVRAALHAGATPAQALQVLPADGPLEGLMARLRRGATLADVVSDSASPLVRALAAAEEAGAAATPAVDGLIDAAVARNRLSDLVHARSVQARMTARLLVAFPLVGAALTSMADPAARAFFASSLGIGLAVVAGSLILAARLWITFLVGGVDRAVARSDPLGADARTMSEGLPTVAVLDLLAIGLAAGLSLGDAVSLAARHGPVTARTELTSTARAMHAGIPMADAFPPALQEAAAVLAVAHQWGAPAAPSLRLMARDLSERASFAAEVAAERLAVHLVFPTTLLLVPAFGLLVVAPLLASAIDGFELGL